ncbi:MAG TPA: hypothetical protein VGW77_03565 [Candidatus Binatia bacterium]|jgi:hypothetical protein|nr:hypothetical protein [Candidatus Binatia bacterium]
MSRHRFKIILVSLVAFVLLYYSVAWAVLRCFHIEGQENYQVALDTGERATGSNLASPNDVHEYLDCMGSDYHTETLAGVSESLQQRLLSRDIASRVGDISIFQNTATAESGNHWLRALFDGAARAHPIGPPRYLSLSVLRI